MGECYLGLDSQKVHGCHCDFEIQLFPYSAEKLFKGASGTSNWKQDSLQELNSEQKCHFNVISFLIL